jgi:hypothetical protein
MSSFALDVLFFLLAKSCCMKVTDKWNIRSHNESMSFWNYFILSGKATKRLGPVCRQNQMSGQRSRISQLLMTFLTSQPIRIGASQLFPRYHCIPHYGCKLSINQKKNFVLSYYLTSLVRKELWINSYIFLHTVHIHIWQVLTFFRHGLVQKQWLLWEKMKTEWVRFDAFVLTYCITGLIFNFSSYLVPKYLIPVCKNKISDWLIE